MSVSLFVCQHENNTRIQFWCVTHAVAAVVTVFVISCTRAVKIVMDLSATITAALFFPACLVAISVASRCSSSLFVQILFLTLTTSYPECSAVIAFSPRQLCNFLRGYLHLLSLLPSVTESSFWRHREVAVPITQPPWGGRDKQLCDDGWIEEGGWRGRDDAARPVGSRCQEDVHSLNCASPPATKNVFKGRSCLRWRSCFVGPIITQKCHCYGECGHLQIDRLKISLPVLVIVFKGALTYTCGVYIFLTERLSDKLEVWSLNNEGFYQAAKQIKLHYGNCRVQHFLILTHPNNWKSECFAYAASFGLLFFKSVSQLYGWSVLNQFFFFTFF